MNELPINQIICGSAETVMADWPDNSIDCCITSPPYWALRDYGIAGQIGLEKTPEEYVAKLVKVFAEVKRVLRPSGTCWLNLGDSYNGSGGDHKSHHKNNSGFQGKISVKHGGQPRNISTLKPKDLVGIPWSVAFALQVDGWWLRQDIIWAKSNPMPESVKDRCTKSHEYIFLLTKSANYYFDYKAIQEDGIDPESYIGRRFRSADRRRPGLVAQYFDSAIYKKYEKRNKRSVWTVNVINNDESHFARFPHNLISPCLLAGCPPKGIVLDPFIGSGTVAELAIRNGRRYIGIELNPKYIEQIAINRINAVSTGVPVKEAKQGQQALFT